jgi:hypothetical protein
LVGIDLYFSRADVENMKLNKRLFNVYVRVWYENELGRKNFIDRNGGK